MSKSEHAVAGQGPVGQPQPSQVQPPNLTDNWAHPSRGPRLPEIPVDAAGNPTESPDVVAHKRAVTARMLEEFAQEAAAQSRRQAVAGQFAVALSPLNSQKDVVAHLVARIRAACHGAQHIEQNVLAVLRDAGLVL